MIVVTILPEVRCIMVDPIHQHQHQKQKLTQEHFNVFKVVGNDEVFLIAWFVIMFNMMEVL